RLDPPDTVPAHVGGAQTERDALVAGIGPFLELVEAFGPQEDAADELAGMVHDDLHQLLGLESTLLDEDGPEPLAFPDRLAGVVVLRQRDLVPAEEQFPQPFVAVGGRGVDDTPARHLPVSLDPP